MADDTETLLPSRTGPPSSVGTWTGPAWSSASYGTSRWPAEIPSGSRTWHWTMPPSTSSGDGLDQIDRCFWKDESFRRYMERRREYAPAGKRSWWKFWSRT